MKLSRALAFRLAILVVLVAVALVLGLRTLPRIHRYRAVEEVCAAADRGEWQTVLDESDGLVGRDTAGRRAAQCRCRALLETGDREACTSLLEELLTAPGLDDWLPDPVLTAVAVRGREEAGDMVGAADLARRGALEYPEDRLLPIMELTLRSRVEDETSVLAEVERRLAERAEEGLPPLWDLQLELANRFAARGEWERARTMLGDDPDRFPERLREPWFGSYTNVLAGLGRADELARAFDEWRERGGEPARLLARHAVLRSLHQIEDAQGTTLKMLQEAVDRGDELEGDPILPLVYARLIGGLVVSGRHEEALRLYDQAVEKLGSLDLIERDNILRSATQATLGEEGLAKATGTLRVRIADARAGDRLLVSPDASEPVDAPYQSLEIPPSGPVEVTRGVGTWPMRWVLRGRDGRSAGSGAVWVRPGESVDVSVERRPAPPEARPTPLPAPAEARPADGKRRVFQVILDCGEWRTIRYGLARGELPFFRYLVSHGHRAVLESRPPSTAIAISKLVYPQKRGTRSFPELLLQLGREIEGLNFVGRNPFSALEWVLPEEAQLFETFAHRGLATVNLLHSYGSLQVGRNAQVVGPGDEVRQLPGYRSSRPLDESESALLFPASSGAGSAGEDDGKMEPLLEEMAADFDLVAQLADERDIDFVALRVASVDILTHSRFQDLQRTGQDDGDLLLYRAYRYIDRRLAELSGRLDGDDVLIVMSDHGIRTPLEHDHRALFLALGAGIEPGRSPGSPPIQEVSGWIADLLGMKVDWPGAGPEDWIRPPAPGAGQHEATHAEAEAVR